MEKNQDWEAAHLEALDRKFLRNSSVVHDEEGYAAQMEANLAAARTKTDHMFDFIDKEAG